METTTTQKRKKEIAKNNLKQEEPSEKEEQNSKNENETTKDKSKGFKNASTNAQKLLFSHIDPHHTPLMWWETKHVRYAINYPPVKSRLEKVMGTHVVRLTDYNFMQKLATDLHGQHVEEQKIRIEKRKLAPPSIIKHLLEISSKSLSKAMKDNKHNKIKMYV